MFAKNVVATLAAFAAKKDGVFFNHDAAHPNDIKRYTVTYAELIELLDKKLINIAGDDAYYHCGGCGMELLGEDVGECAAGGTNASGDYAPCPKCGVENSIIWDRE